MTSDLKSPSSGQTNTASDGKGKRSGGWLAVGAIAAASAALGGLAAVWYYRKALSQLREAENEIPDSTSGTTEDGMGEDF
jgi:hypothetical protein